MDYTPDVTRRRRIRPRACCCSCVRVAAALLLMSTSWTIPPCSALFARPFLRSIPRSWIATAARPKAMTPSQTYIMPNMLTEANASVNSTYETTAGSMTILGRNNSHNNHTQQDDDDRPSLRTIKQAVSSFLNEPLVEVLDCFLVLASSLFVAISTIDSLPSVIVPTLTIVQDIVAGVFVLEFFARWFCSTAPRGRHFTQPLILVDVFVVLIPFLVTTTGTEWLPAWLTSSSSLINLRLLRVLRLQRVLQNMKTFTRFERALGIPTGNVKAWQLQLARVVLSVFTLVSVATGLIYTVEHAVNPQISDYFTALYFGLTTLTTVGFGDITPVTWQGKLVVSMSIMAGVTVIPAQGAALIDALLERQQEKELREAKADIAERRSANGASNPSALSRRRQRRPFTASGVATTTASATDESEQRMTLEVVASCSACGANMHWSTASYCWQCGNNLLLLDNVEPMHAMEVDNEVEDPATDGVNYEHGKSTEVG